MIYLIISIYLIIHLQMDNLIKILNKGTKRDIISLIDSMPNSEILDICLNPANFIKLYYIYRSYSFYEDDMETVPNCILDILLECKDLTKSKHCILTIFKVDKISQIIAECNYLRRVSIYEKLIKCELLSDDDIIEICKNCETFVIKDYYDDGDIYYTYTELTNIFKYILENRPQYAKYLAAINTIELSFWYYYLLEDKDQYSEMFKELLISNIYEFNKIKSLEGAIILYKCNICYFDTILLIIEVIKKCTTCNTLEKRNINYSIFISLKILLCDILPPAIYDIYNTTFTDIKMKQNMYFVLAFCYLNIFEGADIEQVKDFCQSIYVDDLVISNINISIQLAIEYAPNITHLKKYNI